MDNASQPEPFVMADDFEWYENPYDPEYMKQMGGQERRFEERLYGEGFVYFLQAASGEGPIKIGHTRTSVRERVSPMQATSPVPLQVLGYIRGSRKRERELHLRFADQHSHGEWYEPTEELLTLARSERSGYLLPLPGALGHRRRKAV